MSHIEVSDIADIAIGAAFLGTGGGGDPLISQLACENIMRRHARVKLISVDELADDALVVAIGGSGAPSIMLEKMPHGGEGVWALQKLEAHLGRKASALISFEVGGSNSLLPIMTAAQLGIPVVDADGMGRALPEMQMVTFSIYGISGTPMVVVNEFADSALIETRNSATAEAFIRQLGIAMGGQCTSAEHSMSGQQVRRVAISGSISLARDIGRLLRSNADNAAGFFALLQQRLQSSCYGEARHLFDGKVIDSQRALNNGFDVGEVWLESFCGRKKMRLTVKNEYVLAEIDGRPAAMVPDLICLIDNDTCQPVTAERIRFGQRLSVIAIGAPELLRSERALKVVGPRCFGFDLDFTRLEDLAQE